MGLPPINPELFQSIMSKFGLLARQLEQFDSETKRAMVALVVRAIASGNANGYLKERLRWIDEREHGPRAEPAPPPPPAPRREPSERPSGPSGNAFEWGGRRWPRR